LTTTYIALLRAVNVGGTGKLASGNVVFDSALAAEKVRLQLEKRLLIHAGKAVGVLVRSADEMRSVLKKNPFPEKEPRLTHAVFLHEKPAAKALDDVRGRAGEEIRLGQREIYVYYPLGAGQSKLQIPAGKLGTARNMNTVAKLVEMSSRAAGS
jgi:uncharacterized protein (DUF1697 family)